MIRGIRVLALAGLLVAPAGADWLVLRDGSRLETDGPWQVKGRQVVFTRPGGALAALRLADVDLEASTQATASAVSSSEAEPAPSPPVRQPRQRPSVLVLTNDDLPSSGGVGDADFEDSTESDLEETDEEATAEGEDDREGTDGASDPQGATEPVEIVSWREVESSAIDGLEIVGSVRNRGQDVAADVRVQIQIPDDDGGLLVDARAFLERSSLAPGRSSTFRALLTGIYSLPEEPIFQVTSERFTLQLVQESKSDEDNEEYAEPVDGLGDGELDSYPDHLNDDPDELDSDSSSGEDGDEFEEDFDADSGSD